MKKLLNILYITTENARIQKERETLVIEAEEKTLGKFPIHMLQGLVVFGFVYISPYAMAFCAEKGISITFLNQYGKFLARVEGPVSGNILLRKEQYRISDSEEKSAMYAQAFIASKIANGRSILMRQLRNQPDLSERPIFESAILRMGKAQESCGREFILDSLRGIEGFSADDYFSCFNDLIIAQKEDFVFEHRNRRPPLDNVNALLSFVYTLLTHDCRSALEGVGLDPQAGFLHRDRPGRPSLALDLMEEFRHCLADRLVLSLINLQQVNAKGFTKSATGAVEMNDETRKIILNAWQKRKQDEIKHPYFEEKVPIGILFHLQALLLARTIRGDLSHYPAFVYR
jgi:CRISPR-associated protein Cas1